MGKVWVITPKGSRFKGFCFRKRGPSYQARAQEDLEAKDLRGEKVILLVDDHQVFFNREWLIRGPEEIIKLQVKERLRSFGFNDENLKVSFKIEEESETQVLVSFLGGYFPDLELSFRRLVENEVRVEGVKHRAVALAGLGQGCEEPLFIAEAREEGLWLVLTHEEKIYYLRFFEAEGLTGLNVSLVEEAILSALDYAERGLKKSVSKLLPLGPKRDLIPKDLVIWNPFSRIGKGFRKPSRRRSLRNLLSSVPSWLPKTLTLPLTFTVSGSGISNSPDSPPG
jgi:hypothetical protein